MTTISNEEATGDNLPGLYAAVRFTPDTVQKLVQYQEEHNIPNPVPPHEFHCTIVYSRKHIEYTPETDLNIRVNTELSVVEQWETGDSGCLVWHFYSHYLHGRFKQAMASGATYDFPEYKCHVTLSYDLGDFDGSMLPTPDFDLILDHEYTEELDNK